MTGERGIMIVVDREAGTAREALRLALDLKPEISLIDISLPDQSGIHLTRQLGHLLPAIRVMIVSVHSGNNYIAESFQAGARGYVVKESVPETLLEALCVIAKGGYFLEGPVPPQTIERLKAL
ncbi:MAG: response regulator transcription factor, partial [Deltaproteobacteria bacterium]